MDEENRRELLLWVEKSAIESLKSHHVSADVIAKEAATTLTVFLAAMGGSVAYALKVLEGGIWAWQSVACIVFGLLFLCLSTLLVWRCLLIRVIDPVFNEPRNLYLPRFPFLDVVEEELKQIQSRIESVGAENGRVVWWLNRLRLAAALSPVVTALIMWVFWWRLGF